MKEIELTKGHKALVDDADYDELKQFSWRVLNVGDLLYATRNIVINGKRTTLLMHRQISGVFERKTKIDHEDGNGLNNQRSNLRVCTHTENLHNSRKKGEFSSVYKGVYKVKKKTPWRACIVVDKKRIHLGYFATEIAAAEAYNTAAQKYFGTFAYLNNF